MPTPEGGEPARVRCGLRGARGRLRLRRLGAARIWQASARTPGAARRWRSLLRFRVDADGHVHGARMFNSTGTAVRDAAVIAALQRVRMERAPPPDMLQPLTMLIVPLRKAMATLCGTVAGVERGRPSHMTTTRASPSQTTWPSTTPIFGGASRKCWAQRSRGRRIARTPGAAHGKEDESPIQSPRATWCAWPSTSRWTFSAVKAAPCPRGGQCLEEQADPAPDPAQRPRPGPSSTRWSSSWSGCRSGAAPSSCWSAGAPAAQVHRQAAGNLDQRRRAELRRAHDFLDAHMNNEKK